MTRHENWPILLDKFIECNRNRPFERGQFDCALFAGLALDVITVEGGFTNEYVGLYKTKKGAFNMLKSKGLNSLIEVANKHLGSERANINFASRGDIVAVKVEKELALAVIDLTGRRAVTPGKDGLIWFEKEFWLKVWSV